MNGYNMRDILESIEEELRLVQGGGLGKLRKEIKRLERETEKATAELNKFHNAVLDSEKPDKRELGEIQKVLGHMADAEDSLELAWMKMRNL